MTSRSDMIDQAAMTWLIRVQDPTFDQWGEWEAWLTGDPRHAAAYWRLAEDDADLVEPPKRSARPSSLQPAPRRTSRQGAAMPRRTHRSWLGVGIAAAVALACGVVWLSLTPSPALIETGPGETRSVVLADGTTAHLAGASRLALTSNSRVVTLQSGRATFEATHEARRPFTVLVADTRVVDLGTVFDVTRLDQGVRVEVSQGAVRVDRRGRSKRLGAGDGLTAIGERVELTRFDPGDGSGWRRGRLSYRQARLSTVAQDLGRALGIQVQIPASLADRSFSGSLDTTGDPAAVKARLEALLGVEVQDDADGWRIATADAP